MDADGAKAGKTPPLKVTAEPKDLPEEYQRVTIAADLEKIRTLVESGAPCTFAHFGEVGTSVRIR